MYILMTNGRHILGSNLYCGAGIMGNGAPGYTCGRGELMMFETVDAAEKVRLSFTQPDWWDVFTPVKAVFHS